MFLRSATPSPDINDPGEEWDVNDDCMSLLEKLLTEVDECDDPQPSPALSLITEGRREHATTILNNAFFEKHSALVSELMEDDFERIEISYSLRQCFLGDQGLHLRPKCANMKVILGDNCRHILLNLNGGTALQIPMDHISKVEVYNPKIEGHSPIIRLTVTEYIGYMVVAKKRSMKERRHQLEATISDRALLKLHRNCLTFLLKPQKHRDQENTKILCKVKFKRELYEKKYYLNAEGAMNVFQKDVNRWMDMSVLEPIPIRYERISDDSWYDFLEKLELVCIKDKGVWTIEPKRHILRLKNYTSSFLLNTPERLIELYPPDHKLFPLQEKHNNDDLENEKNDENNLKQTINEKEDIK